MMCSSTGEHRVVNSWGVGSILTTSGISPRYRLSDMGGLPATAAFGGIPVGLRPIRQFPHPPGGGTAEGGKAAKR